MGKSEDLYKSLFHNYDISNIPRHEPSGMPAERLLNAGHCVLLKSIGSDLDIVNDARTSFDRNKSQLDEADLGLLNMLIRDRHGSPFEHSLLKFHVKAPIFVVREWQRHRIASYNEMSLRYHVPNEIDFYIPSPEAFRTQVGKPGSYTFEQITDEELYSDFVFDIEARTNDSIALYKNYINQGVAKELARSFLPVNIYSKFIFTVNLRSLMNFISLRNDSNALLEIRVYAEYIEKAFAHVFPETYKFFIKNGRNPV